MKQLVMLHLLLKGKPNISSQKLRTFLEKIFLMEIKLNIWFAMGYFLLVLGGHLNLFLQMKKEK